MIHHAVCGLAGMTSAHPHYFPLLRIVCRCGKLPKTNCASIQPEIPKGYHRDRVERCDMCLLPGDALMFS